MLGKAGTESVKLPPRAPNLNAYAERFVRTIKEGCLDQMIFFGAGSLRQAIHEFVIHYHQERNHQGLENRCFRNQLLVIDLQLVLAKALAAYFDVTESCEAKFWL